MMMVVVEVVLVVAVAPRAAIEATEAEFRL